ncbi:MAG: XTP/dITP diphosphatase [Dehalococcoidia bacterium]
MHELLLATNNPGKARELSALIRGEYWVFTTPAERGVDLNVEETGSTFEENAVLKARSFAGASGLITLADDSGLEVDALEGEPGVFSARYAGRNATDKDLYEYLLSRLADYPWEKRQARFRCVISIAFPDGEMVLCKGECPGVIAFEPKGNNGFGYDPVFWLPEHGKTMAELTPEEKNRISHRGKAAEQARLYLDYRLAEGTK